MIKVFGIPNCDNTQKAIKLLKEKNIDFQFHDYKKLGVAEEKLMEWCNKVSWELLVNKRGTTWKGLDIKVQNSVLDSKSAIAILKEQTSIIKRPIVENGNKLLVGLEEINHEF